jgi:hypothetical protein
MMSSNDIVSINVDVNDIFEYVVGNCQFCPIEKKIDNKRFAVYDPFIYDSKEKKMITQGDGYENFCSQVSKLKSKSSGMQGGEIWRICEELLEIAPKTIFL